MIRFQTSGRAKNDKLPQATRFAKELADCIINNYSPVSVQVYSEVSEDCDNIYWYSDGVFNR
jgi:hypothetical protein